MDDLSKDLHHALARRDRLMAAETTTHRVRWFGILPDGERVPRTRYMNGRDWGWDVECSCGWVTRTGGAIQERIREEIADHRLNVAIEALPPFEG